MLTLSLNEALRLALENNNEKEVVRGEVLFGETALHSLEAFYDPVFSLTPQINHSSAPTAISLGGPDRSGAVKTTDLNFNSSVIKPFRKGGGRYEVFFNNAREMNSSTFAQLSPFFSSSFGVQFTEMRIIAGTVAPLERAEVQTELANREGEFIDAPRNVSVAENTLKRLLLRDAGAKEWSASLVPTDEPVFDESPLRLDDALDEARANRPELTRLRLQQDIDNLDSRYWSDQARPRVDVRPTISTIGLAGTPTAAAGSASQGSDVPAHLDGGYARTLGNLLSLKTHDIVVGVVIEIPFRNRKARAEMAGARIRQTQLTASTRMQEQDIEFEARNAAQSVESARLRILSARVSRHSAELQRVGEQRLYEVSRSTTFFLFQGDNQLSNARSRELRAQADYTKALADLQHATSMTQRANNVMID